MCQADSSQCCCTLDSPVLLLYKLPNRNPGTRPPPGAGPGIFAVVVIHRILMCKVRTTVLT